MTIDDGAPVHDGYLGMLEALASQAGEDAGVAMTLFLGGGVLTGTLIGRAQWEHLWLAAIATTDPELAQGIEKGLSANRADGATSGPQAAEFLHMKDATLITGSSTRAVDLWRGRTSTISGWALGRYN